MSAPTPARGKRNWILAFCAAAWLALVSVGMMVLLSYEFSPGAVANPSDRWPPNTTLKRARDMATLVMLAHPHCPCTRASLGELNRLMARLDGHLIAQVLFYEPDNSPADWRRTDLWRMAAEIPHTTAAWDLGGSEARRFGAATSGQVFVYSPQGRLVFNGGITPSRGHYGDSTGRSAIISAVTADTTTSRKGFVFGCSLLDASSRGAIR